MSGPVPKRAAYEPAAGLLAPTRFDPRMRRPIATTTGAVLVVLRVVAGALVILSLVGGWDLLPIGHGPFIDALLPSADRALALTVVVAGGTALLAVELVLAFLIHRGLNWPRVLVMVIAVCSIGADFFAWRVLHEDIELEGRFVSLALDILILLALSSRDAAAYARRNERG